MVRLPCLFAVLLLASCGVDDPPAAPETASVPAAEGHRYSREILFVGRRQDEPLVTTIVSRVTDLPSRRVRELRGWLAHEQEWERFLDDRWRARRLGSPWTLVPHGQLRLAATPGAEIENVWFREGSRSLRLEVGGGVAAWNRGSHTRVRLFSGTLAVGAERTRGVVAELLRLDDSDSDGRPMPDLTHLLLASGDSVHLVAAVGGDLRKTGPSLAWWRGAEEVREWQRVELTGLANRPLAEARREIPYRWRLSVPDGGIIGEIEARGLAAEIGEERGGLRAVEVRYTVVGWVEREGRRMEVVGVLKLTRG